MNEYELTGASRTSRPRVAWFSPISSSSPLKSSYFSKSVILELSWQIEVFTDTEDIEESGSWVQQHQLPLRHYLSAFLRHEDDPFDFFCYNLEDHPRSKFMLACQRFFPGISIFHDANFTSPHASKGPEISLQSGAGQVPEVSNHSLDEDSRLIQFFENKYSQETGALEIADVQVGTSLRTIEEFNSRGCQEHTYYVTPSIQPFAESRVSSQRESVRGLCKLNETDFLISLGGRFYREDRFEVSLEIFRAVSSLDNQSKRLHLIWVLSTEQEISLAKKAISRVFEGEAPANITIVGAKNDEEYLNYFIAADAALSLKFDPLRGLPSSLLASLCAGIPSLVSNFGPSAEIPDSVVFKIPIGPEEVPVAVKCLQELQVSSQLCHQMSADARKYFETVYLPKASASDLENIWCAEADNLRAELADYERAVEICKESFAKSMLSRQISCWGKSFKSVRGQF